MPTSSRTLRSTTSCSSPLSAASSAAAPASARNRLSSPSIRDAESLPGRGSRCVAASRCA